MATPATSCTQDLSSAPTVCRDGAQASSAPLVGVCGSGMKALAELLAGLGWKVSGSDQIAPEAAVSSLARRGLVVHAGHHVRFLPDETDVLVYSPAVDPENAERRRAAKLGIPQL